MAWELLSLKSYPDDTRSGRNQQRGNTIEKGGLRAEMDVQHAQNAAEAVLAMPQKFSMYRRDTRMLFPVGVC